MVPTLDVRHYQSQKMICECLSQAVNVLYVEDLLNCTPDLTAFPKQECHSLSWLAAVGELRRPSPCGSDAGNRSRSCQSHQRLPVHVALRQVSCCPRHACFGLLTSLKASLACI